MATKEAAIAAAIDEVGLGRYRDQLLAAARPAVALAKRDAASALCGSRFGGRPAVPADFAWPMVDWNPSVVYPMTFLGQVSLTELAVVDPSTSLPKQGLLAFFVNDGPHIHTAPSAFARVIWFEDEAAFSERPMPESRHVKEHAAEAVTLARILTLPDTTRPELESLGLDEDELHAYIFSLKLALKKLGSDNHMFGHPSGCVQNGVAALEGAGDPLLLLQVNNAARFEFGDGGTLYFTMKRGDLEDRRFDRFDVEVID
jgi:uncharacterized protein YwqG